MTDVAERVLHLYYCLKEAREGCVLTERQLTLIASIIREAEEAARADERQKTMQFFARAIVKFDPDLAKKLARQSTLDHFLAAIRARRGKEG